MNESEKKVSLVPMSEVLVDNDFNCRGKVIPNDVVELAKDIEAKGLISPVIVLKLATPIDGKIYKLLVGFRRFCAYRVLARTEIEAFIEMRDMSLNDQILLNLSENIQRTDLNILQEAKPVRALLDAGMTQEQICVKLNKTRGWVQIRQMLTALPVEVQEEAVAKTITQSDIRNLYTLQLRVSRKTDNQEEINKAVFQATRELKDAGSRSAKRKETITNITGNYRGKLENILHTKHLRKRNELLWLMETIQGSLLGNCFGTRILAWAAGEISTDEVVGDIHEILRYKGSQQIITIPQPSVTEEELKEIQEEETAEEAEVEE